MVSPEERRLSWLRILGITVVGVLVIWWVATNGKSFVLLLVRLDPSWAKYPLVGMFLFFAMNGYAFQCLARVAGTPMRPWEWLGITFVANMTSYLLPFRAGAAVKVAYLNRAHGMGIARGSTIVLADNVLFISSAGLCGLLLCGVSSLIGSPLPHGLAAFLGIAGFVALFPLIPLPAPPKGWGFPGQVLRSAHETWGILKKGRRRLWTCFMIRVGGHLLGGAMVWTSFRSFGHGIPAAEALALSLLTALSSLIAITPNNLGIQEVVLGYLARLAGGSMAEGILAGALLRIAHVAVSLTMGPLFLPFLVPGGRLMSREAPLPEPLTLLPENPPKRRP